MLLSNAVRQKDVDVICVWKYSRTTVDMPVYAFITPDELVLVLIDWREQPYQEVLRGDITLAMPFLPENRVNPVSRLSEFMSQYMKAMQAAFENTKQHFPDIPRLNTARIDERLFGYVDIWCPLFQHYDEKRADERRKLGEQIWWYPTDYPLKPCVNFNLDSPGIAPRVIPWLTKRLRITGLLYWGLNREWLTNAQEHERLTEQERISFGMEWMTDDVRQKMKDGLRWPAIPWVPYFRSVNSQTSKPSPTNGGGNLMYPGPDWTPWPSIRLKNLRDGLQDIEYFQILSSRLESYKKRADADKELVKRAEAALQVPDSVVTRLDHFDHSPASVIAHKRLLAELACRTTFLATQEDVSYRHSRDEQQQPQEFYISKSKHKVIYDLVVYHFVI